MSNDFGRTESPLEVAGAEGILFMGAAVGPVLTVVAQGDDCVGGGGRSELLLAVVALDCANSDNRDVASVALLESTCWEGSCVAATEAGLGMDKEAASCNKRWVWAGLVVAVAPCCGCCC